MSVNKIRVIGSGWDVKPLQWALRCHPELWDQHPERTVDQASPHHGVSDIWVRYAEYGDKSQWAKEHESVWYPGMLEKLPVRSVVRNIMNYVGGERLGGILITRVPPFGEVKPHEDHGWHAEYYDKFALQVESAPGQRFCFQDQSVETKPGDLYWFNNQHEHWVTNPTSYERITMIVCVRTSQRN